MQLKKVVPKTIKPVSLRMPVGTYDYLQAQIRKADMTLNAALLQIVEDWVEKDKKSKPKKTKIRKK